MYACVGVHVHCVGIDRVVCVCVNLRARPHLKRMTSTAMVAPTTSACFRAGKATLRPLTADMTVGVLSRRWMGARAGAGVEGGRAGTQSRPGEDGQSFKEGGTASARTTVSEDRLRGLGRAAEMRASVPRQPTKQHPSRPCKQSCPLPLPRCTPEIEGVSTPSPTTMAVAIITVSSSDTCAALLRAYRRRSGSPPLLMMLYQRPRLSQEGR